MTLNTKRIRKATVTIDDGGGAYTHKRGNSSASVIKPKAGRNIVRNGSFRRSWRYWDIGAEIMSLQLDYAVKRYGPYGLRVRVGSAGVEPYVRCADPAAQSWTAGQTYSFSFWIFPSHATGVQISFQPAAEVVQKSVQPGRWNRVEISITKTATATAQFVIGCVPTTSANATDHYMVLSEVQLEIAPKASTFIDGALTGPGIVWGDYYFEGTPGDSPSLRSESAVRGGEVVNFAAYGFRLVDINGLGIGAYDHSLQPLAQGGESYQGTNKLPQSFTIVGDIVGASPRDFAEKRRALFDAISPWRTGKPRPVVIRVRFIGEAAEDSRDVDIVCTFDDGMSAGLSGGETQERVALSFTTHEPAIMRPEVAGAALFGWKYASPLFTNGVMRVYNKQTGQWSAPLDQFQSINGITADGNGNFWIYGLATSMGGNAQANYIARYNPATNTLTGWGAAAGGLGVGVYGVYVAPSGTVYAYGKFSQLCGITTNNLIQYDPVTNVWSACGSPNDVVNAVVEWRGLLIIGGIFTNVGGVGVSYIASHPLTAPLTVWSSVTLALTPTRVESLFVGGDNLVYVSGEASAGLQSFVQAWGYLPSLGGTTLGSVSFAGEVFSTGGRRIKRGTRLPDGRIAYLFEASTSAANATAIYSTDGTSANLRLVATLAQPGYPSTGTPFAGKGLRVSPTGNISAGVDLAGVTGIGSVRVWNNWIDIRSGSVINKHLATLNTGGAIPSVLSFDEDNAFEVYVHSNAIDYTLMPGVTTVSNVLDLVSPRISVKGPGTLTTIENASTGQRIDLNVALTAGEILTVDCNTGVVESSTRGRIQSGILTISDVIGFVLRPGANVINVSLWPDFQTATQAGAPTLTRVQIDSVTRATSKDGRVFVRGDASGYRVLNEDGFLVNGAASVGKGTSGSMSAITPDLLNTGRGEYAIGGWANITATTGDRAYIDAPVIDMDWPDLVPSIDYAYAE